MTEKQKPFAEAPDPKLIPDMLDTSDVAAIVRSQMLHDDRDRETRREKNRKRVARGNRVKSRAKKGMALGAVTAAAVAGVVKMDSQAPRAGEDKVYPAQVGDTEWSIGHRAYPNIDPRAAEEVVHSQEPEAQQKDHTVLPGEKFYFSKDAQIGSPTKAESEAKSSNDPSPGQEG